MIGLLRAEWLRLRKRRSLQVIVVAIPLLSAFLFMTSYQSTKYFGGNDFSTDPAVVRQQLIDQGAVSGVPPQEAEQILNEMVTSMIENNRQVLEQQRIAQAAYAFPQSILTILGNVSFVFFALILLTALVIGDEFGWGTIRGALLASNRRSTFLATRVISIGVAALLLIGVLLLLGVILPVVLGALEPGLPPGSPVEGGGMLALLGGLVVTCLTVILFATLVTVLVRSGGLTLVVALVYVAVETAIQGLLLRFPEFQTDGDLETLPTLLPVRAVATFLQAAMGAAGLTSRYGEEVNRDLGQAALPLEALAVWGLVFGAIAFWRFSRMDIVE